MWKLQLLRRQVGGVPAEIASFQPCSQTLLAVWRARKSDEINILVSPGLDQPLFGCDSDIAGAADT